MVDVNCFFGWSETEKTTVRWRGNIWKSQLGCIIAASGGFFFFARGGGNVAALW